MEDNTKSIVCNEVVEENGCACDNVAECADVDAECAGVDEELAVFDDLSEPILIEHKRKPVGGIIAGIFNIIFMLISAIPFGVYSYLIGAGYYSIYELNHVTTEGFEGLGPALAIALVVAYGAIVGGVYLVSSIPSLVYFIVARFNRSKFFKISTIIVSALYVLGWVLTIFTYVIFVLGVKFGWFTA